MVTRRELSGVVGLGALTAMTTMGVASTAAAQAAPAETTFELIRRAKKLRVARIVGTEPYYHKGIATGKWTGFCMSMAEDLAKSLEAEVSVSETTWGNAVMDLQANKIDIMFGLSPTPSRGG